MLAALTQLVFYLPTLLVHTLGLTAAFLLHERNRAAARLLGGGEAAQLLAGLISLSLNTLVTGGLDLDIQTLSLLLSGVGLLTSLVRAAGEVAMVAAVWVAVTGALPTGRTGKDPYGY